VSNFKTHDFSSKKSEQASNLRPVNIIAKKRPPPLNIGYNDLGV